MDDFNKSRPSPRSRLLLALIPALSLPLVKFRDKRGNKLYNAEKTFSEFIFIVFSHYYHKNFCALT